MKEKILIVDDDPSIRKVISYTLSQNNFLPFEANDGKEALKIFNDNKIDLVITDLEMPELKGMNLIREIKNIEPEALIIVITAYGTIETAVEAMKLGAYDFITKPFNRDALIHTIKKAIKMRTLELENRYLKQIILENYDWSNIITNSPLMKSVLERASQAANVDSTVLIMGESGTGKELLAKGIHFNSNRKNKPFIIVNCGAIPENLLESELFGHKKGSFTGAIYDKKGKFEEADGGTLFLDEIAEIPPILQVKLLRVLQDKAIDKIGETKPINVDIRIISATNKKLEELVKKNLFREDLYYRLNVIPIYIPPLRERKEDIPLLANYFLEKANKKTGKNVKLSKEILSVFSKYPWYGNVRELANLIERLVVFATKNEITIKDLPADIFSSSEIFDFAFELPACGINLKELEKNIIIKALEKNNWNQIKTAKFLGITRNTLIYRMNKFGIEKKKIL